MRIFFKRKGRKLTSDEPGEAEQENEANDEEGGDGEVRQTSVMECRSDSVKLIVSILTFRP